ncbi:MAG: phytoene/squalene synthase family protein [Chthoniobacterales bacterium]
MSAPPNLSRARLLGVLLRSVSRSFYLSIRLLPIRLREPIGLAYLLARATDTIADTTEIELHIRLQELAELAELIQGRSSANVSASSFAAFATMQKDAAERALIEALPTCMEWLRTMRSADRDDIRNVLATINEGQTLDLQYFGGADQVTAFETAADLDRYTYLVAGCVGKFWTELCFRHLSNFTAESKEKMLCLGVEYGKGLQLVNILRDVGADLRAGRCYLPAEDLRTARSAPAELARNPAPAKPLLRAWGARAEQGIAAGVEYACAIRPRRVRLATALPALIGARTLALLRAAGADAFSRRVKVSRSEVRKIVGTLIANFTSRRSIRSTFEKLSS